MDAGRDDDITAAEARDFDRIIAKILDRHVFQGQGLILADDPDLGVSPV